MSTTPAPSFVSPRERLSMDPGWTFHLGDIPAPVPNTHDIAYGWNGAKSGQFRGGAAVELNDSAWRAVDLPHDWMVEGRFSPEANLSQGYLPAGTAWYRKTFVLPAADEGRRLFLEFDGVFRDATVYLNGVRLGSTIPANTTPEDAWKTRRFYTIPAGRLTPGAGNVLAIHSWNIRTTPDAWTFIMGPMRIYQVRPK